MHVYKFFFLSLATTYGEGKQSKTFYFILGPLVISNDNGTSAEKITFPSCQCKEGFEPIPGKCRVEFDKVKICLKKQFL